MTRRGDSRDETHMKKPYKSLRMFESDFLESLSHVHPITPLVVWAPVIGYLIWRSFPLLGAHVSVGLVEFALLAAAGFITWTFTEYVLHRFVFHYQGNSWLTKRIYFIIHGNHHDDPNDPTRLVMPPVPAIILAAILFTLFRAVLGPVRVEPFFAFFLVGYLCYDYTHYAVHHFTPRTRVGRYLKQYHMFHHFRGEESRWGVSSPLWDHVFGTAGKPMTASKKPSH